MDQTRFLLRAALVGVFVATGGLSACAGCQEIRDEEGPNCSLADAARSDERGAECRGPITQETLRSQREAIDNFHGRNAVEIVEAFRAASVPLSDDDRCEMAYIAMLGGLQEFLAQFNSLVGGPVNSLVGGFGGGAPWVPVATTSVGDEPSDAGELIDNFWSNAEPWVKRVWENSKIVESIPECEFLADDTRPGFAGNGVPFRLLTNKSIPIARASDELGLELRIGLRWDAVEARAFGGAMQLLAGTMHLILAHSYSFKLDPYLITSAVGIDLDSVVACMTDPGSWMNTPIPAGSEDADANGDGQISDIDECFAVHLTPSLYLPVILRGLGGYFFGDNPGYFDDDGIRWEGFGGADEERWPIYSVDIHKLYAGGLLELSGLFDAMLARANRFTIDTRAARLPDFALVYIDGRDPAKIGDSDTIGLRVVPEGVRIALPKSLADSIGLDIADIETLAVTGLNSLNFTIPDDAFVDITENLMKDAAGALNDVDDLSKPASTLIHISDLGSLLAATGLFEPVPIPDVLALDLTTAFRNRRPMGNWTPYSEIIFDYNGYPVNQWIIETEATAAWYTANRNCDTSDRNSPRRCFKWETFDDADHFVEPTWIVSIKQPGGNLVADPQHYYYFDVSSSTKIDLVFVESAGVSTTAVKDCFGPTPVDSGAEHQNSMTYMYMQDPSLNGLLNTNAAEIELARPVVNNNLYTGCASGVIDEFLPADLVSFHQANIIVADWLFRNNLIIQLISQISGNPQGGGGPTAPK